MVRRTDFTHGSAREFPELPVLRPAGAASPPRQPSVEDAQIFEPAEILPLQVPQRSRQNLKRMAADVSIIVPAYNMERFLVETLDSIEAAIKPTSLAVEVIVMDDGSTDGSLALARNYAAHHANIRVLTQPNAGPSVARNRAINEATGRYIFPLDADDLLGAGFLEHAVQILDTDPEAVSYTHLLLLTKRMLFLLTIFRIIRTIRCVNC